MKYKGYLIDLDGTLYVGNKRLKEAEVFIKLLQEKNIPFLFVTNNSTKTPEMVAKSLEEKCELYVTPDHIYTSGMAAVEFLLENYNGQIGHVIGSESLRQQVSDAGFKLDEKAPQFILQGMDVTVTYDRIKNACLAIQNGAKYILTNVDKQFPTEHGFIPGAGALSEMIIATTGVQPTIIGKPSSIIMEGALKRLNLDRKDVLMVGDNYLTDILSGIQNNVPTLLTLTGVTQLEHLEQYDLKPTHIVNRLGEWEV